MTVASSRPRPFSSKISSSGATSSLPCERLDLRVVSGEGKKKKKEKENRRIHLRNCRSNEKIERRARRMRTAGGAPPRPAGVPLVPLAVVVFAAAVSSLRARTAALSSGMAEFTTAPRASFSPAAAFTTEITGYISLSGTMSLRDELVEYERAASDHVGLLVTAFTALRTRTAALSSGMAEFDGDDETR